MHTRPQWPRSPENCFSLARFKQKLKEGTLPAEFWLGGRVQNGQLVSQQGQVKLLFSDPKLRPGNLVALKVGKKHLGEGAGSVTGCLEIQMLCEGTAPVIASDLSARNRRWQNFLELVQAGLEGLGLQKVTTPTLVINPGMEPHLRAFGTQWKMGSKTWDLHLPTSPEIHLKKLLSAGFTDIFEIKNCFRSEELSQHHEPEFSMLEWYRAFADLRMIEDDLRRLVAGIAPGIEFVRLSLPTLFQEHLDFNLRPDTSAEDLRALCKRQGVEVAEDDIWDDLYTRLVIEKIEPTFDRSKGTFLYDYPASQAALARVTKDGWADRFEFFWKGLEIANAFHELNDPEEQLRRHTGDQDYRREHGLTVYPIDLAFITGLRQGMPPSGGIAMGLDRLCMAVYDLPTIQELRLFGVQSQVEALKP